MQFDTQQYHITPAKRGQQVLKAIAAESGKTPQG